MGSRSGGAGRAGRATAGRMQLINDVNQFAGKVGTQGYTAEEYVSDTNRIYTALDQADPVVGIPLMVDMYDADWRAMIRQFRHGNWTPEQQRLITDNEERWYAVADRMIQRATPNQRVTQMVILGRTGSGRTRGTEAMLSRMIRGPGGR